MAVLAELIPDATNTNRGLVPTCNAVVKLGTSSAQHKTYRIGGTTSYLLFITHPTEGIAFLCQGNWLGGEYDYNQDNHEIHRFGSMPEISLYKDNKNRFYLHGRSLGATEATIISLCRETIDLVEVPNTEGLEFVF